MTRIVVGIDGSSSSENALRWALEEARLRPGSSIKVVHAYRPPEPRYDTAYADVFLDVGAMQRGMELDRGRRDEEEIHARQGAERLLEKVLDAARTGPIDGEVELLALPDDPATCLIDLSRDADMVVVGSRGRGGFKGLLLGSVSQQCLQHACGPVVVVR